MPINERLIMKMLLEEKLQLITSADFYRSSSVGGYEFPELEISAQPFLSDKSALFTQFPSDNALASAFNRVLSRNVYLAVGEEARAQNPYACYSVSEHTAVSEDEFLSAQFHADKISGLSHGRQPVCYLKGTEENSRYFTDVATRESAPHFVLVASPAEAEEMLNTYRTESLVAGLASTCEEVAKYLYLGCSFVFLKENVAEELVGYFAERTRAYREAYVDYREEKITLGELDRRARNFEIFDEALVDGACSRMISILRDMKEANESAKSAAGFRALEKSRKAVFNEITHAKLARTAAAESVILLKNQDNILPLHKEKKIALVGDCAQNPAYQRPFYIGQPTSECLPFEAVNSYELNAIGFAAGYANGERKQTLIDNALSLCADADCAIVYLCVPQGETVLPAEQKELIDALFVRGVRIIAVLDADGVPDLSFLSECSALLLSQRGGQEASKAVFDIICGRLCPSGKLTQSVSCELENGKKIEFPFGFGLSYTSFEYRNLKVNDGGISFTVENTGACGGYATPMLYVQKDESELFPQKTLRGFTKVYIKKNDAVRVEIPFDENTFRYYDKKKKRYRIDGGEYVLTVAENGAVEKLSGSIVLSDYKEKTKPQSEKVDSYGEDEDAAFTKHVKDGVRTKSGLSFGIKLFLAIAFFLYASAMLAVFAFSGIVPVKNAVLHYSVIGAVFAVAIALFITYTALIAKHRTQPVIPAEVALADMLNKMSDFEEIAKVTYQEPISEETQAQEQAEDEPTDEEDELPAEKTYDASFTYEEDETEFTDRTSLGELENGLREYARAFGVEIDVLSARQLFAAISACRIVVADSVNRELLPRFCAAVNGYFKGAGVTAASAEWNSVEDLLWQEEGEKRVLSAFSNTLHAAEMTPEKDFVAVISDVSAKNAIKWFAPLAESVQTSSKVRKLDLDGENKIALSENVCYLLVADEEGAAGLPRELVNASLQIQLMLSEAALQAELPVPKAVSRTDFAVLLSEARDTCFLGEKVWKKLDELFEIIGASERFRFGNKNVIQSEKFTSVLMECGADEGEALHALFLAKIVLVLKFTRLYSQDNGDNTLASMIEKLFPDEDFTKVRRALLRRVAVETAETEEPAETVSEQPATEEAPDASEAEEFVFEGVPKISEIVTEEEDREQAQQEYRAALEASDEPFGQQTETEDKA